MFQDVVNVNENDDILKEIKKNLSGLKIILCEKP